MITSVEISNLRGIQQGKLENLTPLTILVGPNSSGKSTILDALLIGASSNSGRAIGQVVTRRKGVIDSPRWLFPKGKIQIKPTILVQESDDNENYQRRKYELSCQLNADPSSAAITCSVESALGTYSVVASFYESRLNSYVEPPERFMKEEKDVRLIESINTDNLEDLYTQIVEQGLRDEVTNFVKSMIPDIDHFEILTSKRQPVLYIVFVDRSTPVKMSGDGVQSLIALSMELMTQSNGIALIEEPEVHQHPMAMGQSAEVIWTAVRRGTQVILSTHSIEMVDLLLSEVQSDAELAQMSVYRTSLREGCLRSVRVAGEDIAFQRVQIGDDLR